MAGPGGVWADLGAGAGTFTRALASLLGAGGRVHAIDRDPQSLREIDAWAARRTRDTADVLTVRGDFTTDLPLPPLDGALLANALHFVAYPMQADVIRRVTRSLRLGGRVVLVEYDRRGPNRWVPFPVSRSRFADLAAAAGLGEPVVTATRPSAFGGEIYAAVAMG